MAGEEQQEKQWQRELRAGKTARGLVGALKGNSETVDTVKKELEDKHDLGIIGSIIFIILLTTAIQLDATDVASGGFLTYLGIGLFKIMQTIGTFFGILIVTGDPIRALLGRRTAINIFIAIAEMFAGVNILPLHTAVIIITVIDLKTNFLSFKKYLSRDAAKEWLKRGLEEKE